MENLWEWIFGGALIAFAIASLIMQKKINAERARRAARIKFNIPTSGVEKGEKITCRMNDYTVVDIETTGLSPTKNDIIEIAAIKVRNKEIVDRFQTLINPQIKLPPIIKRITGISDADLSNAPLIEDVFPKFIEFVGDDMIVAHNATFDIGFISANKYMLTGEWFVNTYIDTLDAARRFEPEESTHKLDAIVKRYGISQSAEHRAMADAELTYKCYEHIKKNMSIGWQSMPLKIVPISSTDTYNVDSSKSKSQIEVTDDEKNFLDTLIEKCAGIETKFIFERNSQGHIKVSHKISREKYPLALATLKLFGRTRWIEGIGITNKGERINGEISDFLQKIDALVNVVRRRTNGEDVW